jgi:DNA transposition AAA+ family ATPase
MVVSQKNREALRNRSLPSRVELIPIARDYMARCGLNLQQFSDRVGYAAPTMSLWFTGKYRNLTKDSDLLIRARIIDLMNRHPVGVDATVAGTLHDTENARLLREDFYLALDRARIIVRHGNPGTQKSAVTQFLIAELNQIEISKNGHGRRAYRVVCLPSMRPMEMLREIARVCGVPGGLNRLSLFNSLGFHFGQRRALLILDEAQHLSVECLENLRRLNDEPPNFGLLLLGSHDLKDKFSGFSMEQWRSRLHILKSLPGINREEGAQILRVETPHLSDDKIVKLLDLCTVKDQGALVKEAHVSQAKEAKPYISARDLFWNIREIQEARAAAQAGKGGAA